VNESEAAANKMVFEHQQRIEELKQEHEQLVTKLKQEHERIAKAAAAQLAKQVEAIEVLNQNKFQLESTGKELSLHLSSVKGDYSRVETEVLKLRDENVKLGQSLHSSEKVVVGLQRDFERKVSEVTSLEKTNAGLVQRVAALESDVDDRKTQIKTGSGFIDEQRGKVVAARAECVRLNEVIATLHAELQSLKDGHLRKNDVLKKQHAEVEEGARRLKELNLLLDESKRAATDAQIEVKKLTADLEVKQAEIDKMREEIGNQKNVSSLLR
jgi:predicted  nucleic acid-binding Zn-ribbon protein